METIRTIILFQLIQYWLHGNDCFVKKLWLVPKWHKKLMRFTKFYVTLCKMVCNIMDLKLFEKHITSLFWSFLENTKRYITFYEKILILHIKLSLNKTCPIFAYFLFGNCNVLLNAHVSVTHYWRFIYYSKHFPNSHFRRISVYKSSIEWFLLFENRKKMQSFYTT